MDSSCFLPQNIFQVFEREMKVQFPDVLCQTGQRPMTLIWTSWTLKMYLKTNLCATGMLINIVSRKDFSYSLVEIESKQCFNSSSQLAPIHPQLKLIHIEHMVLKARYTDPLHDKEQSMCKKVLHISICIRNTWEEEGAEKGLQYFLSRTCAPGICSLWGVFASFSTAPPNILVHFLPFLQYLL